MKRPAHPPVGRRDESGSSLVELVLLTPVLMFAVFLIVQAALYMHARHVLLAAAQQGARLARAQAPSDGVAVQQASDATRSYIHQLGADIVGNPTVDVRRANGVASVTVSARAISIVPGVVLHITETSRGPVESFRTP